MTNSRAKGARGEREWRDFLKSYGHEARRGQQFSGLNGDPDVVSDMVDIHFEVKRVESLNVEKALCQSTNDSRECEIPVVAHRRNGEQWKITMWADDWMKLYGGYSDEK